MTPNPSSAAAYRKEPDVTPSPPTSSALSSDVTTASHSVVTQQSKSDTPDVIDLTEDNDEEEMFGKSEYLLDIKSVSLT